MNLEEFYSNLSRKDATPEAPSTAEAENVTYDGKHRLRDEAAVDALDTTTETDLDTSTEEEADEFQPSKLRHLGANALAFATNTLSYASGSYMSVETADNIIDHVAHTPTVLKADSAAALRNWKEASGKEMTTRPLIGSMAWGNLVFGESIALALQGAAQSANASTPVSFGVGIASAAAVEVAFTLPVAISNENAGEDKKPAEQVMESMATAFWLGGAMGVDNQKLPKSQMIYPMAAYMIFGTALAAAGEVNDIAEQFIEHKEIVLPALIAWGIQKKVWDKMGWKTLTERMAIATVNGVRRSLKGQEQNELNTLDADAV